MNMVSVRIPTPLRSFTGGLDRVDVAGSTVGEVLAVLGEQHAGLRERVLTPEGEPRQFVNIFVGSDNIRTLGGLETAVSQGDTVSIIPAVAGGGP